MNLIHDAWIPVISRDGARAVIAPHEITSALDRNPIIAFDWPRSDFNLAQHEFLIGLLATAWPPADDDVWLERWQQPPAPDELRAALEPFARAFNLDGEGPRFMQDFDAALSGDVAPIEGLLLDTPGEDTVKKNRDLMAKRERYQRLARSAAAIALYTLQTHAPQGGSGHRMALRDGGPLTTLVLPGGDPPLWHTLWANVPEGRPPRSRDLRRLFPWLAPTRVSPAGELTTPADAHPLQCWWGMPRRVRLVCEPAENGGASCDLTGAADAVLVTGRIQQKHGINYATWMHPLTPYWQRKDGSWRACRPESTIGYRHWAALVAGDATERPAQAIGTWQGRARDLSPETREQTRMLYAGFECKKAAIRSFVESEMPLPGSADALTQRAVDCLAKHLIGATDEVARALQRALGKSLSNAADRLWQTSEKAFYRYLQIPQLPPNAPIEQPLNQIAKDWLRLLQQHALAIFDAERPLIDPAAADPARIVRDRRYLTAALHGHAAGGKRMFTALLLPVPKGKAQ